jgi:hypothetical protein
MVGPEECDAPEVSVVGARAVDDGVVSARVSGGGVTRPGIIARLPGVVCGSWLTADVVTALTLG